ncbi:mfs general substrate transporter [Trichoderma arundinaceum]|uniref:Mfs general substrate transporter n=1 Tax=Trichoderma arundinaceum TaxID=490622 RepID=A0A395NBK9_TRIAR|nr:mfs general substrate transporter [Trichoderma arundinaceum]
MDRHDRTSVSPEPGDEKMPKEVHLEEAASDIAVPHTGERSQAEKKLVRKTDFVVCMMFGLSYFFAYLDRGAIGNARIMGLQEDLGLSDDRFFNCLLIFFIGYAVFEGPTFYLIRVFHAPTVYAISAVVFGVSALLTAYAKTYAHLLVLRLFMGFGEATVQTGFVYVSLWYRREEMSVRASYLFAFTPIAGAISGLISYGVNRGLEGAGGHPQQVLGAEVQFWQIKTAIKDIKVWVMAFITATHATGLTGFSLVMRFIPMLIVTGVAIIGFIIILAQTSPAVGIFASSVVTAAVYPGVAIVSGWIPSSSAGYTKRAAATWITQIFCQAFSILASRIYNKPPRFFKGHGVLLGFLVLTFILLILIAYLMKRHNQKKDALAAEWDARGERNPDESKTLEELCDDHPSYRYLY